MRQKLGLEVDEAEEDQELITDLLQVMHDTGADFTNTFRRLADFPTPSSSEGHLTTHHILICLPQMLLILQLCKKWHLLTIEARECVLLKLSWSRMSEVCKLMQH